MLQVQTTITNMSKKLEWLKNDERISSFGTEVLELQLAFFQAVIRDTDAFRLIALPSSMWLPSFQDLSSSN